MNINSSLSSCLPCSSDKSVFIVRNELNREASVEASRKKRFIGLLGINILDVVNVLNKLEKNPIGDFVTSMIPVYGTVKEFQQGNIGLGVVSAALDVATLAPVVGATSILAKSVVKVESIAFKAAAKNLAKTSLRAVDPGVELLVKAGKALSSPGKTASNISDILSNISRTASEIDIARVASTSARAVESFAFKNIVNPVISLRGLRNPFWYVVNHRGFYKLGADTTVRGSHVMEAVDRLKGLIDRNERIYILTGSHGERFGNNWLEVMRNGREQIVKRADKLIDHKFMMEDVNNNIGNIYRNRVEIIDVGHPQFTYEEFKGYIEGNYHVILGFCYGRNDKAFRARLNLGPVTSYVRELTR